MCWDMLRHVNTPFILECSQDGCFIWGSETNRWFSAVFGSIFWKGDVASFPTPLKCRGWCFQHVKLNKQTYRPPPPPRWEEEYQWIFIASVVSPSSMIHPFSCGSRSVFKKYRCSSCRRWTRWEVDAMLWRFACYGFIVLYCTCYTWKSWIAANIVT